MCCTTIRNHRNHYYGGKEYDEPCCGLGAELSHLNAGEQCAAGLHTVEADNVSCHGIRAQGVAQGHYVVVEGFVGGAVTFQGGECLKDVEGGETYVAQVEAVRECESGIKVLPGTEIIAISSGREGGGIVSQGEAAVLVYGGAEAGCLVVGGYDAQYGVIDKGGAAVVPGIVGSCGAVL